MKENCKCIVCTFITMTENMENLSQVLRAKEYYDMCIRGRLISERLDKALGKINYKL